MALYVKKIAFSDFRSYETLLLDDLGMLTVFVGPNAVGKTNIIEGVQLLTAMSSFRSATMGQLVRQGADQARLLLHVGDGNRELDLECLIGDGSRKYRLNGKPKKASELRGLVPAVAFTPDDLDMVKGSSGIRRRCLDALGSQLSRNYGLIKSDYEKVVRHKGRLLKEEASTTLIESVNDMLVVCGAQLTRYRASLFDRLIERMRPRYEEIAGRRESFSAAYIPSWVVREDQPESLEGAVWEEAQAQGDISKEQACQALEESLERLLPEERAAKRCLVGPHLDQISFFLDGMDATHFASQGQQRSIVLAEKLAEAAVIEETLGQKPVLLLDDVMSELDESRRQALVGYIDQDVQVFITTANLAYFDRGMLDRARMINLPIGR